MTFFLCDIQISSTDLYQAGCRSSISVLKDDQLCIFWKWEMHQSAKLYQLARGTKEINDTIGLTQIGYSSAHHFFSLFKSLENHLFIGPILVSIYFNCVKSTTFIE